MRRQLKFFILVFFLTSCAQSDPGAVMKSYLEARVTGSVDTMRHLSCAAWESQVVVQSQSFRSMNAQLQNVSCSVVGQSGDYTLVHCDGKIVTSYNGENREWPLTTYQLKQEDGEWKMCGEAR